MTEKTCDTCGKKVTKLNTLDDEFQQDRIAEICDECLKETTDLFISCMKALNIQRFNFIRKFLRNLRKSNIKT